VCAEAILISANHIGVGSLDFSFLSECGLQLPLPLGQISVLLRGAGFAQGSRFSSIFPLSISLVGNSRRE
jgi:hypothetical protein